MAISPSAIQNIHSREDFLRFLSSELSWPIPDDLSFDNVTFDLFPDELGIKQEDLRGSTIAQLRPFVQDQPWGIFILQLKQPRLYLTELRNILRALEPMKRKLKDFKTWNPQHVLFICTSDWSNYTFAHFEGEHAQKAKISIFGWEYRSNFIRTLCEYNLNALKFPEGDLMGISPSVWIEQWSRAFDVKPVTDTFFAEMKRVYGEIQNYISGIPQKSKSSFAQLLINRLLFLKFLERKGWLFLNEKDSIAERHSYLSRKRKLLGKQNQWEYFFRHLFFKGLNRPSVEGKRELTDGVISLIGYVPFLNGGLFEESKEWNDNQVKIENTAFDLIFETLLDRYNFTIHENTPLNVEVALNPDLLGYAYEEFIAEQHGQGAFYTHPTEVGLMCRESLKTYLQEHTSVSHSALASLVDEWNASFLTEAEAFDIYKLLLNIKILDPAIGSGAYPVRMMQELVNIHKALAERMTKGQLGFIAKNKLVNPQSIYELKLSVIQNNIYGVDIDFFAVEIAKLRFWLSLVVDYEKEISAAHDIENIPALPNLDFKMRVGDSLVATPGRVKRNDKKGKSEAVLLNLDTYFSQHSEVDAFFSEQTKALREKKEIFFNFEELRKRQPKLYATSKEHLRKEIAALEANLARQIGFQLDIDVEECKHILWQIHFAEIFSDERFGFDICIANPPYLRQEKINEIFAAFGMDITKDDLVETYETLYKHQDLSINKQSDLYVYFFMRGVQLLKEQGVLCYICSNSWLDVGYGARLQEFLLRTTRIKAIYDNSAKRSFEKADVNTTINLFVKDSSVEKKSGGTGTKKAQTVIETDNITRFVTFKTDFETAARGAHLQAIENAVTISSNETYRVYPIQQKELWRSGLENDEENETQKFIGDKWGGKYLRAPDIFFTILEKGKDKLVRLGDIAEVRFGIKTGANEFFYLDDEKIAQWGIEKEFLKPVIFSLKELETIRDDLKNLDRKLFYCHKEKSELKGTNALKYIKWGETETFSERPTVKGRKLWYSIGESWKAAPLIFPAKVGERFLVLLNAKKIFEDKKLYGVTPFEKEDNLIVCAILNSTLTRFYLDLTCRQLTGAQAIADIDVVVVENIKIVSPKIIDSNKLINAFDNLAEKKINSIISECGFDKTKPIRAQTPNPLPDRKALDDVIFDVLGLTQAERNEVYWSVCELVQNRLNKAKSV
ncbi:MAG: Eco57I restriction-modification methylase domain-containing protein [Bacteroidota bacterium]